MSRFEKGLREASKRLEVERERRDRLILEASDAGITRRQVAEWAGLSAGRVQQIITEHHKR